MLEFFKCDPTVDKEEALLQARYFLDTGVHFKGDEKFSNAAILFLAYGSENELAFAGPRESAMLSINLERMSFQSLLYRGIVSGFFIPYLDDSDLVAVIPVSKEVFEASNRSPQTKKAYEYAMEAYKRYEDKTNKLI